MAIEKYTEIGIYAHISFEILYQGYHDIMIIANSDTENIFQTNTHFHRQKHRRSYMEQFNTKVITVLFSLSLFVDFLPPFFLWHLVSIDIGANVIDVINRIVDE